MSQRLKLIPVTISLLAMTACTATMPVPTVTPTVPVTYATFDPPTRFDTSSTVHLREVDTASRGMMSGYTFYTMTDSAIIWGVDVRAGKSTMSASLTGREADESDAWRCWQQTADDKYLYTIAANYGGDPSQPVPVQLTTVDKASGNIVWQYSPPTQVGPMGTECDVAISYTITATDAGLLINMWQAVGTGNSFSAMLDPAAGDVRWQSDTSVVATDQAKFGLSLTMAPISIPPGSKDPGVRYTAQPVDLATGTVGKPLSLTGKKGTTYAGWFQLVGRSGDNLILIGHDPADAANADQYQKTTSTIYAVSASTGQAAAKPLATAASDALSVCSIGAADRLVCLMSDDDTTVSGVSLTDGSTVWQHHYAGADVQALLQPLLFHGYLYGQDPTSGDNYVLDVENGNVVQSGQGPAPIAVNETGMVFMLADKGDANWQCLWAPAVG